MEKSDGNKWGIQAEARGTHRKSAPLCGRFWTKKLRKWVATSLGTCKPQVTGSYPVPNKVSFVLLDLPGEDLGFGLVWLGSPGSFRLQRRFAGICAIGVPVCLQALNKTSARSLAANLEMLKATFPIQKATDPEHRATFLNQMVTLPGMMPTQSCNTGQTLLLCFGNRRNKCASKKCSN